jgi:hypothetical protein
MDCGHTVILFFIRSTSAADPPCASQKMGDKGKLDNATGKWDLKKAYLHMYKFAMTREFLAGKLDLPICSSTSQQRGGVDGRGGRRQQEDGARSSGLWLVADAGRKGVTNASPSCLDGRRRAAAVLPPPLCRRCHRAAAANTALQMPSPRCSLPPRCFC